jgi:integrase
MAAIKKYNITDTWLQNIKGKPSPQEFLDAPNPGLRIRITPKGVASFVYSYSHPQTDLTKRVKIGNYPGIGIKEARVIWARLSDIRKAGIDPRDQLSIEKQEKQAAIADKLDKDSPVESITVNKLIRIYTDDTSGRNKSWKEGQRVLQKEFGEVHGYRSAYDITREDVRAIVMAKRHAGKNVQAKAMISQIRAMYNWAIESPEYFPRPFSEINPAVNIDKKSQRKQWRAIPRNRGLNEDELKIILKLLPKVYKDILTLILLTGCRFGEATDMLWSEVYKDEWRQPGEKTKNSRPHKVYLSTQAQAILNRNHSSKTWVWPNKKTNSGHVRRDTIAHEIRAVDFGLQHWTTHDFRRAISSWLARQGIPREVNDRMLNHVNSGIHEVYNLETYEEPAREAWQQWGDYIEGLQNA